MLLVLGLAAMIWGIGRIAGISPSTRTALLLGLFALVLALQFTLPDGHPLRDATGETPALWLLLAGIMIPVLAYRYGLGRLRAHAQTQTETRQAPSPRAQSFSEAELNRYARHITLRDIGGPGQKRLKEARVLVIGAGGLGAPVLQYLAAAGVGTIGVIDDDAVESSNLQRQVLHIDARIGMPKVFSAQQALEAQNPFVTIQPYHRRFTQEIAATLLQDFDMIIDGSDNFETRYLANATAVAQSKPLISGALSQWEGQVSVFHPAKDGPCYQCIFPQAPAAGLAPSCAEAGVAGPLPGVVGSIMALEATKLITQAGDPLRGRMVIFDGFSGHTRQIALKKRPDCPCCAQQTNQSERTV